MKRIYIVLNIFVLSFLCVALSSQAAEVSSKSKSAQSADSNAADVKKNDDSAEPEYPFLLIDDFDKGETDGVFDKRSNSIGLYQGTWAKRPSWTVIQKSTEHRRGDSGRGLIIDYHKQGGWCGWYTLLGGVDTTDYNILSFWVKGEMGGERFDIGIADQTMQDLYIDAVYAGPVSAFLPDGVTTRWQEVKIPLSRVSAEIDVSSLGSIVLWFRYGGKGRVYIEDMSFKQDPEIAKIQEENIPRATAIEGYPRSLWVWKIDPVLNPRQQDEMIDFCKRTAIEIIYLYFGDFDENDDLAYTKKLEKFMKRMYDNQISVEILTGNPTWAMKENHHLALKWMKPFLEYNKSRPKELRFHGVSFDVEPYLTKEWEVDRERVKADYLVLMQKCRDLIDSYPEQKFKFGGAIPVFYKDEPKFEKALLKLVDYAALMDYYDISSEIIANGQYHLDMAAEMGSKIWVGLEIQDLVRMHQGMRRNTFFEEGWEQMEREMAKVHATFEGHPGYAGFAMHCYYAYRLLQKGRNTPQNPMRLELQESEIYRIPSYETEKFIQIDGKLEEWNLGNPFPLNKQDNVVYGAGAWKGTHDLSGNVYSMWDRETLYFAFEIIDDAIVQKKTGPEMWEGDHIEFWLDVDLGDDFIEAMNSSDDFQFGFSPGNFDRIEPEIFIWTPPIEKTPRDYMEIGSSKTEKGYVIEVAIQRDALYNDETVPMSRSEVVYDPTMHTGQKVRYVKEREGKEPRYFYKGYKLGISVDYSDCDNPTMPQKCLMSTSVNRVWGDPTTFGYLELKGPFNEEHQE